jgi:tRNA threonylcarbamoyladenosine biosynthesis protein TsaE
MNILRKVLLNSRSAADTKKIGRVLGKHLKAGDVVALQGALGAGKTTITKGIAAGLGFKKERSVASPTFVLMHEYQGRERIRHLDWYRLKKVTGPDAELLEESLSSGVTLIEWPERGKALLPKDAWSVLIEHRGADARRLTLRVPDDEALLRGLRA